MILERWGLSCRQCQLCGHPESAEYCFFSFLPCAQEPGLWGLQSLAPVTSGLLWLSAHREQVLEMGGQERVRLGC